MLADVTFGAGAYVTVGSTDRLEFDGAAAMNGGHYTVAGAVDLGAQTVVHGATCMFSGDGELRIGASSETRLIDADLGSLELVNRGSMRLELTVAADRFTAIADSAWHVSLSDQLVVANAATLAGDLNVELPNGVVPESGDSFTVLTAGSLDGAFDNVASGDRISTEAGSFLVTYGAETNTVVLSDFAPCSADLSGNGIVDTDDMLTLLACWGTPDGDVTGDATTDVADLLAVIAAWGSCP